MVFETKMSNYIAVSALKFKKKGLNLHQSLLPGPAEYQPVLTHIKLPLKRRKAQDDAKNCTRCPDSSSIDRKKLQICEEKSVLKRTCSQISTGSQSISETCSPERKRMGWPKTPMRKNQQQHRPSLNVLLPLSEVRRGKMALSSQGDAWTSDSTLTERMRNKVQRVAKIWMSGSSYIKWRESGACEKFGANLVLYAKVQWFGKGRMRWNGILPCFHAELSTQSPPDILVVHARGNHVPPETSMCNEEGIDAAACRVSLNDNHVFLHQWAPSVEVWKPGVDQSGQEDRQLKHGEGRRLLWRCGYWTLMSEILWQDDFFTRRSPLLQERKCTDCLWQTSTLPSRIFFSHLRQKLFEIDTVSKDQCQ